MLAEFFRDTNFDPSLAGKTDADRVIGIPREFYLGGGCDSFVFRYGNDVFKFHTGKGRNNWSQQLSFYMAVTNTAKDLLESGKLDTKLPEEFKLQINPINDIVYSEPHDSYVAICPLVEGIALDKRREHFIPDFLYGFARVVNTTLKIKGVELYRVNVKFVDPNTFVITDLCSLVRMLKQV